MNLKLGNQMEQSTRKLIEKYSPMWTNKQIWEFDQLNEDLTFDLQYVEPGEKIGFMGF